MAFLWNFHEFRVFVFGCRAQSKNQEITENLYFFSFKAVMHLDQFYDHYFNFLCVRNDITEAATEGVL